jgi:nucleoside-diphosphate-sugar epimerase
LTVRVFVTGATGFIGSAIVGELIDAGHQVSGLARSDQAADALAEAGAEVHRGSLEDPDSLHRGAATADGVIHCAYIHDFSQMEHSASTDLRAVETLGAALEGSGRPLVITSGTALLRPGRPATEDDSPDPALPVPPRYASEQAAWSLATRGVRTSIVRCPPSVHGAGDHGFVPRLVEIARAKGVSGYISDGANRWATVHRLDAARVFRLALETAPAGSVFHAVGEEGVATREIAEVIGRHLKLPVESIAPDDAAAHFEWLGRFFGLDAVASSALTRERLGWTPVQHGLIADLEEGHYFARPAITA